MNTEIEQMTRELATYWAPPEKYAVDNPTHNQLIEIFLSQVTALLDKQREEDMEFAEWIGLAYGYHDLAMPETDMKWIYPLGDNGIKTFAEEYTTSELFDYWLKNVKK